MAWVNGWDMFLTLGQKYWTPFGTAALRIASFYFGAASFVCLLQFSLRIILLNRSKHQFLELSALVGSLLLLVAVTLYGALTGFSNQWLILSQVLMRYLLGFPGAILTAIGFWKQRKLSDIQSLSSYHVDRSLIAMAIIFALTPCLRVWLFQTLLFFRHRSSTTRRSGAVSGFQSSFFAWDVRSWRHISSLAF
jgi:hypothetical protein